MNHAGRGGRRVAGIEPAHVPDVLALDGTNWTVVELGRRGRVSDQDRRGKSGHDQTHGASRCGVAVHHPVIVSTLLANCVGNWCSATPAGPRATRPAESNSEPWHGQTNSWFEKFVIVQVWCVQIAERAVNES